MVTLCKKKKKKCKVAIGNVVVIVLILCGFAQVACGMFAAPKKIIGKGKKSLEKSNNIIDKENELTKNTNKIIDKGKNLTKNDKDALKGSYVEIDGSNLDRAILNQAHVKFVNGDIDINGTKYYPKKYTCTGKEKKDGGKYFFKLKSEYGYDKLIVYNDGSVRSCYDNSMIAKIYYKRCHGCTEASEKLVEERNEIKRIKNAFLNKEYDNLRSAVEDKYGTIFSVELE